MKKETIVITGVYGTDTVRQLGGQAAILPIISGSVADGVEIRRELFSEHELASLPELAHEIER